MMGDIERGPEFSETLLSEALALLREGDTGPARANLRDLFDFIGESEALPIERPGLKRACSACYASCGATEDSG